MPNPVFQTESAECGIACIANSLNMLGGGIEMAELRQRFSTGTRGATMADLLQIASSVGLVGRTVRCELGELKDLSLPAILHWNMNHFVVLKKVGSRNVTIL